MEKIKPFQIERQWGNFRQFNLNTPVTVKIVTIKPGEMLSLQSHTKRSEFWRIIRGGGIIEIGDDKYDIIEGDEHNIPVNAKHRAMAGLSGLTFLEIDTGNFEENDEVRYEDKYGRT
jgi:mannose-6-phosphate isomerase-like protein (cupin superfamily)